VAQYEGATEDDTTTTSSQTTTRIVRSVRTICGGEDGEEERKVVTTTRIHIDGQHEVSEETVVAGKVVSTECYTKHPEEEEQEQTEGSSSTRTLTRVVTSKRVGEDGAEEVVVKKVVTRTEEQEDGSKSVKVETYVDDQLEGTESQVILAEEVTPEEEVAVPRDASVMEGAWRVVKRIFSSRTQRATRQDESGQDVEVVRRVVLTRSKLENGDEVVREEAYVDGILESSETSTIPAIIEEAPAPERAMPQDAVDVGRIIVGVAPLAGGLGAPEVSSSTGK
jgi:hypothetical protein